MFGWFKKKEIVKETRMRPVGYFVLHFKLISGETFVKNYSITNVDNKKEIFETLGGCNYFIKGEDTMIIRSAIESIQINNLEFKNETY